MLPGINTFHGGVGDKGRPYFDVVGKRNVTAVVGQTARLNCRVKHLGDQQVSIFVFLNLYAFSNLSIFTFANEFFRETNSIKEFTNFILNKRKKFRVSS